MLDERDLQAIAQIMGAMEERLDKKLEAVEQRLDEKLGAVEQRLDEKLGAVEQRLDEKLRAAEQRIAKNTVVLMDAEFRPQFQLLSEELDTIRERLPDPDLLEGMQEQLDLHYAMLKKHTKEIQALKKAN